MAVDPNSVRRYGMLKDTMAAQTSDPNSNGVGSMAFANIFVGILALVVHFEWLHIDFCRCLMFCVFM